MGLRHSTGDDVALVVADCTLSTWTDEHQRSLELRLDFRIFVHASSGIRLAIFKHWFSSRTTYHISLSFCKSDYEPAKIHSSAAQLYKRSRANEARCNKIFFFSLKPKPIDKID